MHAMQPGMMYVATSAAGVTQVQHPQPCKGLSSLTALHAAGMSGLLDESDVSLWECSWHKLVLDAARLVASTKDMR